MSDRATCWVRYRKDERVSRKLDDLHLSPYFVRTTCRDASRY